MKSLIQYFLETYKESGFKEYFGESFVIDDLNKDYILENLNTHDPSILIKKLETIKYFIK